MPLRTALVLMSCTFLTGPIPAQFPRVRDSAGVRIIDNASRATAPVNVFLETTPLKDIGGSIGNSELELVRTPYLATERLSNGNMVVTQDFQFRIFGPTGKPVSVHGRKGEGPREFQQIARMCRTRGDTLVLLDPTQQRISIVDGNGAYVREFHTERSDLVHGCFSDGTFLLGSGDTPRQDSTGMRTLLTRRTLQGVVVDTVGHFWGGAPFNLYLTSTLSVGIWRDQIYLGDPRSSSVKVYDARGKLLRIIRTGDPIDRLTSAESDALRPLVGVGGAGGPPTARPTPPMTKPTQWPAYGAIQVDASGRLWMSDMVRDRKAPVLWTVFDSTGAMLGRMSMPPSLVPADPRLLSFVPEGAIVRREDDEGFAHLTIYPILIRKP